MYSFESRVRFSEVDQNGYLTLKHLVDYFQDCCIFHSEDVGLGQSLASPEERKKVWMLVGWQIEINRLPKYAERITTTTWPYSFVRFKGGRNFVMTDESGEIIARADSQWVYMNLETGFPERVQDNITEIYEMGEPMELGIDKKKLRIPEECRVDEPVLVRKEHLDTNRHVNNGQYIMMAADLLPEQVKIHRMKVEYKSQAKIGDVIIPKVKDEDGKYLVALCSEDDKAYAIVEFE